MDFSQVILKKNIQWKIIKILTLHPCSLTSVVPHSSWLNDQSLSLFPESNRSSSLFWGHFCTWHLLSRDSVTCIIAPEQHHVRMGPYTIHCVPYQPWLWLERYSSTTRFIFFYMRHRSLRPGDRGV